MKEHKQEEKVAETEKKVYPICTGGAGDPGDPTEIILYWTKKKKYDSNEFSNMYENQIKEKKLYRGNQK